MYSLKSLIVRLELLKAEIEWDKSIDYQIVLSEAIERLRGLDDAENEVERSEKEM